MNIISLVPVHPCREPIIQAALELKATLIWADDEEHFDDLLRLNSLSFGIMASVHCKVGESRLIRHLRAAKLTNCIYVMLLDARSDHRSIARALGAGADQAEVWPVDPKLLSAQIKAIIGRDRNAPAGIISFGGVEFDTTTGNVIGKRGRVHLTKVEGTLLETLSSFPNRPLAKPFLHRAIYGGGDGPDMKIIDVFICKLRKKLSAVCGEEHIETVWGRGFRFHADGFVVETTEMRVVSHRREAAE
jgi:DNA-binding response OmpR family regulator